MKKTLVKISATILAMIISLAALPAFAAESDSVFVGGKIIGENGYWVVSGNSFTAGTAENFNIAFDSGTLTLRNAKINSADFGSFGNADYTVNGAIGATDDLNIVLEGKNELVVNTGRTVNGYGYGIINFGGDTFVRGDGELTITLDKGTERLGFYTESNRVRLSDTTVKVKSSDTRYMLAIGIGAPKVEILNSTFDVDFKNEKYAVGIYAIPSGCFATISDSDVSISIKNCEAAYGINIYETSFANSNADINVSDCSTGAYGIFSYLFDCENSYVDAALSNCGNTASAIAYNNAYINGGNDHIYTGSLTASITPDGAEYSAVYINSAVSVFNPAEGRYGGYYKTVNGLIRNGSKNDWNIHYDVQTNTLTLKDAELDQVLRIIGKANIVLKGKNIINGNPNALISDFSQNFSGSGSLTLISNDSYAYYTKETASFGDGVTVTASTNADGSNASAFNSADALNYKWVNIQGNDEPEEEPPAKLSFWQKLINFFKSIGDFFKGLFSF